MRAQINSIKHIVQIPRFTVALNTTVTQLGARSVLVSGSNLATDVREGATIKAIWVELWVTGDADDLPSSFIVSFEKKNTTQTDITNAQALAMFDYANKKNIFYTSQGLANPQNGVAIPVYKGWVKIPKSKQRFGLGDEFVINSTAFTDGLQVCGLVLFKEYF